MNKTQAGRRSVAIDPETVAVLAAWRRHQEEESMAWGPAWESSGLVFTREHGGWIHPETFSWWFDRHVKRIGLPRITVHGLRYTHVTLGSWRASTRRRWPSAWATPASNSGETYAHLIPGQDEQAARIFSARVLGHQDERPRRAVSKPLAEGGETQ